MLAGPTRITGVIDAGELFRDRDDEVAAGVEFHIEELVRFQHLRAELRGGLRQRERLRDDEFAGGQGLQDEKIETRFRRVRSERGAEILGQRSRREWAALCGPEARSR